MISIASLNDFDSKHENKNNTHEVSNIETKNSNVDENNNDNNNLNEEALNSSNNINQEEEVISDIKVEDANKDKSSSSNLINNSNLKDNIFCNNQQQSYQNTTSK